MKIFLCGNFTPWSTGFYVRKAIEEGIDGCWVFGPLGEGKNYYQTGWLIDLTCLFPKDTVKPDLFLCMEGHRDRKILVFSNWNKLKIPKIWWAIDSHLNFRWHKEFAYLFDLVFVAQGEVVP